PADCGLIGAISYVSVGQIGTLTDSSAQLATADQTLRQLDMDQSDMQVASRDMLLSVENSTAAAAQKWFGATAEDATQSWTTLQGLKLPAEVEARTAQLKIDYVAWVDAVQADLPTRQKTTPERLRRRRR
ncbi:MAG TPA: hypothetical protein VHN80_29825, partial [Kineosporiaceae bacterium]|nr:hypothetical protein [Kineosporiaceae bacterium]